MSENIFNCVDLKCLVRKEKVLLLQMAQIIYKWQNIREKKQSLNTVPESTHLAIIAQEKKAGATQWAQMAATVSEKKELLQAYSHGNTGWHK